MEREAVKKLFGKNFIGKDELKPFFKALGFGDVEIQEKPIEHSDSDLQKAAEDGYILIYGVEQINGQPITLRFLRDKFGVNPDVSEPCLYNQDWYLKEDFIDKSLNAQWYLIKKEVYEDSRAVMPGDLNQRGLKFPSAIHCEQSNEQRKYSRKE